MSSRFDDVFAGLIFLAIAAFFCIGSLANLDVGTASRMGPGFFPLMMSAILAVIAVAIMFRSRAGEEEETHRPIPWRAMLFVLAAPIGFGLAVRSLGLVPALLITVSLAVMASRLLAPAKGAILVIGLTAFCVAIFSYGIGLPVELVNSRYLPW